MRGAALGIGQLGAALDCKDTHTYRHNLFKGYRTKPGNSLAKARKKAKARRTAQRASRRMK